MKITATVHYPTGVQFVVYDGPDDRAECERLASEHAKWIGGEIGSIAPTTGEDIANLEADRSSLTRSQPMWVAVRL